MNLQQLALVSGIIIFIVYLTLILKTRGMCLKFSFCRGESNMFLLILIPRNYITTNVENICRDGWMNSEFTAQLGSVKALDRYFSWGDHGDWYSLNACLKNLIIAYKSIKLYFCLYILYDHKAALNGDIVLELFWITNKSWT